ncbi:MAG: PilZ domain-containing protein [Chitinivibrionales bacterium]|nr:PilZ domain-containing protein [Chitinivibrionales bacterium]
MERRRNERVTAIHTINPVTDTMYDLSSSGMCVVTNHGKEFGPVVYIKLNDMILKAKVVHIQNTDSAYRLGLQFWDILPNMQCRIESIVENFSKGKTVGFRIIDEQIIRKALKSRTTVVEEKKENETIFEDSL